MLTQARLKELLRYDAEAGQFFWIVPRRNNVEVGRRAGDTTRYGYRRICIDRKSYQEHRLVWLYSTGEWPSGQIDHINGCRSDNRLTNLRDVSAAINSQNCRFPQKKSSSGLLGVYFNKESKKWIAQIKHGAKRLTIGRFDDPEDAHLAYVEAKRRLHPGCTL